MATIIPTAGTVTKFVAEEVETGGTSSATLDQNELATSLSVTPTASGQSVEAAGNLSVSAGAVFDVHMTGFNSTTAVYASVVFVPNVAGQFVIPTWRNITNDPNANNDFYPQFYLPIS